MIKSRLHICLDDAKSAKTGLDARIGEGGVECCSIEIRVGLYQSADWLTLPGFTKSATA